ncbi:hypothetical protein [Nostocoides vanveenii]|uniref:Uncharacterized protein n=1 Tax=Nostocoides vanveenii TaxID=330835 RepID=A0ABP4WUB9_9MICO
MSDAFPPGVRVLVKDPEVDIATLKEVANIKRSPDFIDFVASGGVASVARRAREKLAEWEIADKEGAESS